ncbi:MAG TPA: WYL domain-containing protein [Smithella sp.]|nr:WYL domain-containing protein [Smithella sp.]
MGKFNELDYWRHSPKKSVNRSLLSTTETGNKLIYAIDKKLKVNIVYSGGSDPPSKRTIEPYRLYEKLGNNYVESYCYKRNDFRTFRIDRVDFIEILDLPHEKCASYTDSYTRYPHSSTTSTTNRPISPPNQPETRGIPDWIWFALFFLLIYFCSKQH